MRRQWTLRLIACGAVGAAVLSGCSEKHAANTTLPDASSFSATVGELPPLGPADLQMPAAARTADKTGAEAFIRYYFDLLNRSLVDLDPQYLRQFAANCEDCERIALETESDARNGYHYKGGQLTIQGDMSVAITAPGRAESAFIADQAAMTVVDSSDQPIPDLVLDRKPELSSGTLATWDADTSSWRINVLTLG